MAITAYKNTSPSAPFTPIAELHEQIDYLTRVIPLGRANFPRIDALKIGMAALCDDEFMAITEIGPGTVTVKRGCADTVPAPHGKDSIIWFLDNSAMGSDRTERSAGEINSVKYSPFTIGGGEYPIAGSGIDVVTYNWRFFRPYPPGQMKMRNARWWLPQTLSADNPNLRLTWAHRDRGLQSDRLIDHDVTSIGPERGTTYTLRVYDAAGMLRRTIQNIMLHPRSERGALIPPGYTYTWQQAMIDVGFAGPSQEEDSVMMKLTFYATREGFDSWQGYAMDVELNTQGNFLKVAQLAELSAQAPPAELTADYPPNVALYDGQLAQLAAQIPYETEDDGRIIDGIFVAQARQGVGQETALYTPLDRNLFAAPYAWLLRRGDDPEAHKLVTVAAKPSDRLTDSHKVYARYDWPPGAGASFEYAEVADPLFTPWVTLDTPLAHLDTVVLIRASSLRDGVSLDDVAVGQVAMVDAEMVRIDEIIEGGIVIARGCFDTVPARHAANARLWLFEAMSGNDPTDYPQRVVAGILGAAAQVKMAPLTAPLLFLQDIPTDRVEMKQRTQRPYPPGQVYANDRRWYEGAIATGGESVIIRWVHRNRTTQLADAVEHDAPDRYPEDGQRYKLSISITMQPPIGDSYVVKIREAIVDGDMFEYTASMARTDGYRAAALLEVCGRVTVGLVLSSIRNDLTSWQGYVIPLLLPASKCPAGTSPGGGQLPPVVGGVGGNGETGTDTPGGTTPGDNSGDGSGGPPDPIGGGGGDNGTGPPPPPTVPPDWPDPIDPPTPDPDDPNPSLGAHWDLNWDRHWDAYNKDNQGD